MSDGAMKILIVEDEQRAREGLKQMIQSLSSGYEVVGMTGYGQNALEMMPVLKPDVVMTDIKMPFMSGLDFIRLARARNMDTAFIIVTAFADFEFAKESISLGVVEYILKPVSAEELKKALQRVRDAKSVHHEAGYGWKKSSHLREQYPEAHPLVLKVLDIIENSYAGKISQKQTAELLGVSSEYLSYLFKKNIGKNFAKFLQEYRIEQAKYRLRTGEEPSMVPFSVGFSDTKYFNKVFREVEGMTVKQFLYDCQGQ